uniref:Uncharacterized protein n=1 Tax=Arundo donax TaxID=35708 RepID=A0A0A8YUV7_ARUDO
MATLRHCSRARLMVLF